MIKYASFPDLPTKISKALSKQLPTFGLSSSQRHETLLVLAVLIPTFQLLIYDSFQNILHILSGLKRLSTIEIQTKIPDKRAIATNPHLFACIQAARHILEGSVSKGTLTVRHDTYDTTVQSWVRNINIDQVPPSISGQHMRSVYDDIPN